jgi:hypothetical protein
MSFGKISEQLVDSFSALSFQDSPESISKKLRMDAVLGCLAGRLLRINSALTIACPLAYNISHLFLSKVTHELNEAAAKAQKFCGFKATAPLGKLGLGIVNMVGSTFITIQVARSLGSELSIIEAYGITWIPGITALSVLAGAEAIKAAYEFNIQQDEKVEKECSVKSELTVDQPPA